MIGRLFAAGVVAIAFVALTLNGQPYLQTMLMYVGIFATFAISWNLLAGYLGLFSAAQPGLIAIGGYASATAVNELDISPWLGLAVGGFGASVVALVLGVAFLRLRQMYFVLATFAFSEVTLIVITVNPNLTGGSLGLATKTFFRGVEVAPYVFAAAAMALAALALVWLIMSSRLGTLMLSIREDETAARASGVAVARVRVLGFLISGLIAGVGGAYLVHAIGLADPSMSRLDMLAKIMIFTILGGIGTLWGPVIGAAIFCAGEALLSGHETTWLMFMAAGVMLIMRFAPGGVAFGVADIVARLGTVFRQGTERR